MCPCACVGPWQGVSATHGETACAPAPVWAPGRAWALLTGRRCVPLRMRGILAGLGRCSRRDGVCPWRCKRLISITVSATHGDTACAPTHAWDPGRAWALLTERRCVPLCMRGTLAGRGRCSREKPLINHHPLLPQTPPQLSLKGDLPVMLLLPPDVSDNPILVLPRTGKRRITGTPSDEIGKFSGAFHPVRRGCLHIADIIGQCDGWVKVAQYMKVVFHAIDPVEETVFVFDIAIYITIEFAGMERIDRGAPVFGTDDQMIEYLTVT